jgi:hypothetical protein
MSRQKPFNHPDQEVRTRSVPTAAALILAGFEPERVIQREAGPQIVFGPAAQATFIAFLVAKQRAEAMLDQAADGAR